MKTKHIIMIIVGAVLLITAIIVVTGIIAVGNYNQVRDRAEGYTNKANAAIICGATNAYNALSDEDSRIKELPETKEAYDKIISKELQFEMDEEEYANALTLIEYGEGKEWFRLTESLD